MVFSGIPFLFFFLPAFFLVYGVARGKAKNIVLLLFSLFFYAWGEPVYIALMIVTTLVDYAAGLTMDVLERAKKSKRAPLVAAITVNLSLLAFFKYADFAVRCLNAVFVSALRLPLTPVASPSIALPIGISFYTFQSMSYTIDRYRGTVPAQKNYADYLAYVSMFPQLIAGPIVRYATVQKELTARSVSQDDVALGFRRFLIGLFRKVLIANQIGALWDQIRAAEQVSVVAAWLGLLCFTLQLYYDFSAYSDMAIGLGRMMGFHFLENFNYPLAATSMTDFWRKWHISLSGWFRDYVYISLGGNRKGKAKTLRNLIVVFFLTGLWHGAFLNYVFWGLYHGLFLILEKYFWLEKIERAPKALRHVYTLAIVVIGFGIFYFENMGEGLAFCGKLFGLSGAFFSTDVLWYARNFLPQLIVACVFAFPLYPRLEAKLATDSLSLQRVVSVARGALTLALFALSVASLVRDTYNPFLYFRF